jgi:SAM-dependent methyltransferase
VAVAISIPPEVRDILSRSTITVDRLVLPPGQLDRKLYEQVNKAIAAAGGKWNRLAKAHLFDRDPRQALGLAVETGKVTDRKQVLQAFYTPVELADRVAELADPKPNDQVLEPSCGEGALIAALLRREFNVGIVGCDIDLLALRAAEDVAADANWWRAIESDFLSVEPDESFDLVVMNPPFAKDQDIDHVMHAWKFVRPGGRLVSIMSATWSRRGGRFKKRQQFSSFVEGLDGEVVDLGGDAFKSVGASVYTVMLRLNKPEA